MDIKFCLYVAYSIYTFKLDVNIIFRIQLQKNDLKYYYFTR